MTTTTEPTDDEIRTLKAEALAAGDVRMAMICELAIDGDYGWAEPGTEMDTLREEVRTQEWAIEQCAEAIADARAQQDEIEEADEGW